MSEFFSALVKTRRVGQDWIVPVVVHVAIGADGNGRGRRKCGPHLRNICWPDEVAQFGYDCTSLGRLQFVQVKLTTAYGVRVCATLQAEGSQATIKTQATSSAIPTELRPS